MVGGSKASFVPAAALAAALMCAAGAPVEAQGLVTIAQLPYGQSTGQVGVSRGDLRVYDVLPTFQVDAAGNVLIGDFLNGRIQVLSPNGTVTSVIQPADEAERRLFPAQLLPLPANRVVTHAAGRLSVYDYGGSRLAVRDQIDGLLVNSLPDGRFLLERPGRQGYTIFDVGLNVVGVSATVPLEFGVQQSTRLADGRDLWTIRYTDGCVGFYTQGQSPTRVSRVGERVSVVAEDRFWILELNGGLQATASLPAPEFVATDAPPPVGFDHEPELVVEYRSPIVGRDGELYSFARRPRALEIVKWNAAALPPAEGLSVRPNRPPVLEFLGPRSVNNAAGRLTFRLRATDPDGDPLSYSAVSLPPGASLNAISGFFDWRPTEDQAGTVQIRFEVLDSSCGVAVETVAITVAR